MLKKDDNSFLTSFFQKSISLFSRVRFSWHVIWSDTRSFFYNNRINQDNFIKQSNKMLPELGMESLHIDGECSSLSNLYIKYAIEQRKHDFFETISDVCFGNLNDTSSFQKKRYLFDDLSIFTHSYSSSLENRRCRDAFSFISRNLVELEVNITAIINKMQAHQRNLYTHITLGHAHSFVLEQSFINNQFVYYVYDPNSPKLPQAVFTSIAVANEINLVVQRIKIDYSMISKTACDCVNMFTYSNTYDPFSKHEPHPFRDSMYSMPTLINRYRVNFDKLIKQFHNSGLRNVKSENIEKNTTLLTQKRTSITHSLSYASFFTNRKNNVQKDEPANYLACAISP